MRGTATACMVAVPLLILFACGSQAPSIPVSTGTPKPDAWRSATVSGEGSFAIQSNGSLWSFGIHPNQGAPRLIGGSYRWARVAAGAYANAAIRSDGTLWTWGINNHHELGLGDTAPRSTPTQVGHDCDWASVACGNQHVLAPGYSLAIKRDGTLWGWGVNDAGQLGLGDTGERRSPARVGVGSDWSSVSCGWGQTMAIKRDGTLWGWGDGLMGQLGLSERGPDTPTQVGSGSNWAQVSCGDGFSLALKKDRSLWAAGANDSGVLGIPGTSGALHFVRVGTDSDWAAVSTGSESVLALKRDGSLWSWGSNGNGELGLGDKTDRYAPAQQRSGRNWVQVSCDGYSAGIRRDGSLWTWAAGTTVPTRVR